MNHPMMQLHEAHAALPGSTLVGDGAVWIDRVQTDTRALAAGDLFVALKGERFDGNDFLAQAKAQGAVAALCHASAVAACQQAGLPAVGVQDTRQALGQLAAAWRRRFDLPVLAVTGSNGKTTVTQMLAAILRAWAGEQALATQGNFNNDIGVPLMVLQLRAAHRIAVFELGMNHPGEIGTLARIAQPTVALVNNAQREHQEFMGTVEAVAEENGQVLAALPALGVAVFPADDAHAPVWTRLAGAARRITFAGCAAPQPVQAPVRCRAAQWHGDHWQVEADTPQGPLRFALRMVGQHNVRNALAAVATALAAQLPLAAIASGLQQFQPVKGRSRLLALSIAGRSVAVVDDTYNANPDSVLAAINVLAHMPAPRLLVLGDMGEVGNDGPAFHREAGQHAAAQRIEQMACMGELSRHAAAAFAGARHFESIDALNAAVQAAVRGGVHSVLVKGSRFMQMERVVDHLSAQATEGKT